MRLAACGVIGADRQQAGILSLCARIRLQRDRVIAGDVAQPFFQASEQRMIAFGLLARRERVQRGEFGPGQWNHLGGGIELHGAGAQWNHRAIERKIAIAQLAHIAQQLGLGAMGVEYRMGQERASALQLGRQRVARAGFDIRVSQIAAERAPHRLDDCRHGGLVQRDAERAPADPQVDFFSPGARDDLILLCPWIHRHRVEECFGPRREAELAQTRRQHAGSTMH